MTKHPNLTISLAQTTKGGEYNSKGELIKPAEFVEEPLLYFKELSEGDTMVYSPHDKQFHYKFKIRPGGLFVQRTNQNTKTHLDVKTIRLRSILRRIIKCNKCHLINKGIL